MRRDWAGKNIRTRRDCKAGRQAGRQAGTRRDWAGTRRDWEAGRPAGRHARTGRLPARTFDIIRHAETGQAQDIQLDHLRKRAYPCVRPTFCTNAKR